MPLVSFSRSCSRNFLVQRSGNCNHAINCSGQRNLSPSIPRNRKFIPCCYWLFSVNDVRCTITSSMNTFQHHHLTSDITPPYHVMHLSKLLWNQDDRLIHRDYLRCRSSYRKLTESMTWCVKSCHNVWGRVTRFLVWLELLLLLRRENKSLSSTVRRSSHQIIEQSSALGDIPKWSCGNVMYAYVCYYWTDWLRWWCGLEEYVIDKLGSPWC